MNQTATGHIQDFREFRIFPGVSRLLSCFLCISAVLLSQQSAYAFDHSHKLFTNDLHRYVRADGVLYEKWKAHPEELDKYLKTLSDLSTEDYEGFSATEKKALWLNAYNALAIKLVIDHYPIKGSDPAYPANSIRQIANTWDAISWKVAGKNVTLYTIAHDILRRCKDCRTHFGIVPCSKSAGILQNEAFDSKNVDDKLDEITHEFMSKPENLQCDFTAFTINVSHIFKWFPLDFLDCTGDSVIPMPPPKDDDIVRNFVMPYFPADVKTKLEGKEMKIIYNPYDWSLNDASGQGAKKK